MKNHYDDRFYRQQVEGSVLSAKHFIDYLFEFYQPESVIEFGCGRGGWLAEAQRHGCRKITGYDGDWVKKEDLLSDDIDFHPVDFERDMIEFDSRHDLAISLEVAEHVSGERAEAFVDMMCRSSDVIIFGAAIKYQGGKNHINEQWQSYWVDHFKRHSYECLDVFRSHFWNNSQIDWHYRQNSFLFIKTGTDKIDMKKVSSLVKPILDIAHPANFEGKIRKLQEEPSWRNCRTCLKNYFKKKIARSRKTQG